MKDSVIQPQHADEEVLPHGLHQHSQQCRYTDGQGRSICKQPVLANQLCYWHSNKFKDGTDIGAQLHELAKSGHSLVGISLKRADLRDLNLVRYNSSQGYDLSEADLYKANLENAHLFHINLNNASLMKANLKNANLHCANLEDCNLLGVQLQGAKIENVRWGKQLLQEKLATQAQQCGNRDAMRDYLEQSEEIYRNLRKTAEYQGLFETSGNFFYREMVVRRRLMPKFSMKRSFSHLVDLFCGYGEKPLNVVIFSIFLIGVCALIYFSLGIATGDRLLQLDFQQGMFNNLVMFLECLYFSVITFTTLGYGDIVPIGAARPIAAFEAFTGNFTMALFVVVFVKKMTR